MDRISVEFTQATTVNEDQLLDVPLAGFYGYSKQWRNAGTLEADAKRKMRQPDLVDASETKRVRRMIAQ